MKNIFTVLRKNTLLMNSLAVLTAVVASLLLPQLFHALGIISGIGSAAGEMFLPMHIPVMIAGLCFGPVVGTAAGILSPLVSFMLSGMPGAAVLPFIVVELTVYGLASGLLSKAKLNSFVKLLIVQVAGHIARVASVTAAISFFGNTAFTYGTMALFITTGVFGILIQWLLIPMAVSRIGGIKNSNE